MHRHRGTRMMGVALAGTLAACATGGGPAAAGAGGEQLDGLARQALSFAAEQYARVAEKHDPTVDGYPRATRPDGTFNTVRMSDWTSGFFPGTLWYLHEYTGDGALRAQAERYTLPLAGIVEGRYDHDLGFQYMSSFGNAYRITGEERFKPPIMAAARALASRFSPAVGAIRSWDHGDWRYPVIIDNMMNLELLTWAAEHGGDPAWERIAQSHARTTFQNHFRPDHGSFHLVDYDPRTGEVVGRQTVQGYQDSSTWARGHAWGIYGFTMMYRETGNPEYLQTARNLVGYALPRLPADHVPCWDYQAPGCPQTANRDASAAAIMASALLELSQYVEGDEARRYREAAERMLTSLSTTYLARGTNAESILLHSVGHLPRDSEVDVGINYADYYYVEALLRYLELRGLRERAVLPRLGG